MADWLSVISTVGFPIACCVAMGWYVKYITDKNREQITKMNDTHKEEMNNVTQALNNNTLVMQKVNDTLEENTTLMRSLVFNITDKENDT